MQRVSAIPWVYTVLFWESHFNIHTSQFSILENKNIFVLSSLHGSYSCADWRCACVTAPCLSLGLPCSCSGSSTCTYSEDIVSSEGPKHHQIDMSLEKMPKENTFQTAKWFKFLFFPNSFSQLFSLLSICVTVLATAWHPACTPSQPSQPCALSRVRLCCRREYADSSEMLLWTL